MPNFNEGVQGLACLLILYEHAPVYRVSSHDRVVFAFIHLALLSCPFRIKRRETLPTYRCSKYYTRNCWRWLAKRNDYVRQSSYWYDLAFVKAVTCRTLFTSARQDFERNVYRNFERQDYKGKLQLMVMDQSPKSSVFFLQRNSSNAKSDSSRIFTYIWWCPSFVLFRVLMLDQM